MRSMGVVDSYVKGRLQASSRLLKPGRARVGGKLLLFRFERRGLAPLPSLLSPSPTSEPPALRGGQPRGASERLPAVAGHPERRLGRLPGSRLHHHFHRLWGRRTRVMMRMITSAKGRSSELELAFSLPGLLNKVNLPGVCCGLFREVIMAEGKRCIILEPKGSRRPDRRDDS